MKKLSLLILIVAMSVQYSLAQRSVSLEKSDKTAYSKKMEEYKKDPNAVKAKTETADIVKDTSKMSAFEKTSSRQRKKMNLEAPSPSTTIATTTSSTNVAPAMKKRGTSAADTSKEKETVAEISVNNKVQAPTSPSTPANSSNSSAIANGQALASAKVAVAKPLKYKADAKAVEYYKELRTKFDEEGKVQAEKDAVIAKEKAKKEEDMKNSRHLSEEQAPQFEKHREGHKDAPEQKTTPEEDYNKLFK